LFTNVLCSHAQSVQLSTLFPRKIHGLSPVIPQ
jgi:hypothetical protein